MGQKRLGRITPHIGIDGHRIGAITLERLGGILFRSAADITALGIEDHRNRRVVGALQGIFGAIGCKIGDLRLVGAHQIVGGIDDRPVESENAIRILAQMRRQASQIRIETDADQGIVVAPGGGKFFDEAHVHILCRQARHSTQPARQSTAAPVANGVP